jgi:hypothetical protein
VLHAKIRTVHEQGYTCISQSIQQQFDTCNEQANQPIKMANFGKLTRIKSEIGGEM